ncbi:MAG TPA: hypothetical protein PKI11_09970 [Candidatus Hydrogenedentes bacterium]|nr:hypothetical protein [Candidatus Hydrogenedentota bacterium]
MNAGPMRAHLSRIMDVHFDPRWGAPYWLERAPQLGFDPRRHVACLDDLDRFGPFPTDVLATRPIEDFIPRRFHDRLPEFITTETGGATGPPKRTAFRRDEFEAAFVAPFLEAAARARFPRNVHWLYIGPSGPHVIGKAARACAVAMGSVDPFMVDFDPRWARRLPDDSLARERYLEHVLAQAGAVLRSQRIAVIFATPPVLRALGERLPPELREAVTGIHLGGMATDPEFQRRLGEEWFPNAVALSGYGNSLAGMCPQLKCGSDAPPEYYPYGNRLVLRVDVPEGATRGRVRFHRLDESAFLPNVVERDEAEPAVADAQTPGFQREGVRDPRPARDANVKTGLY